MAKGNPHEKSVKFSCVVSKLCQRTDTHTHTHTQPFYGSLDFVKDYPGKLVPKR